MGSNFHYRGLYYLDAFSENYLAYQIIYFQICYTRFDFCDCRSLLSALTQTYSMELEI